ncbi:MAG TPA: transposase family protein, partial [Armatimonadota bacterium]
MMSLATKRELVASLAPRYFRASRGEKSRILDEFVASTGYHRKYAMAILKHPNVRTRKDKRERKPRYGQEVAAALRRCWETLRCPCSKRLVPFLSELVPILERYGELSIKEECRSRLLELSTATADRLLKDARKQYGQTTTRSGTLLKHQIPIHTYADWCDTKPGHVEADLVAHCGDTTEGWYLNTLVLVDVATGWIEPLSLLYKGQQTVKDGIEQIRRRLPFPLRGLDCDNGSEFLNRMLFKYCKETAIHFTRCRPYKKNDQCHVEQKNGAVIRSYVGYDRYEGIPAKQRMDALYEQVRLLVNFFLPSMKLLEKTREGARVRKTYDTPRTPYQRV